MPGPPGLTKFARKTLFRFSGTKLNRLLIWHLYEGKPQGPSPVVPKIGHFSPSTAIALGGKPICSAYRPQIKVWASPAPHRKNPPNEHTVDFHSSSGSVRPIVVLADSQLCEFEPPVHHNGNLEPVMAECSEEAPLYALDGAGMHTWEVKCLRQSRLTYRGKGCLVHEN